MKDQDSYMVENQWDSKPFAKLEICPDDGSQAMWDIVKQYPDLYEFGISYIDHGNGKKELIGLSLIRKFPNKPYMPPDF